MSTAKKEVKLIDWVFSWSIEDICNRNLYKGKVEEIPRTFSSTQEYLDSFKMPLIEETRADLLSKFTALSQAPLFKTFSIQPSANAKDDDDDHVLKYKIEYPPPPPPPRSRSRRETTTTTIYEPVVGDLVALTQVKPRRSIIDDLTKEPKIPYTIALVEDVALDDEFQMIRSITIKSSQMIDLECFQKEQLYVVYLTSMVTNDRIWTSLNNSSSNGEMMNMNIIQNSLNPPPNYSDHCDSCCCSSSSVVVVEENQQSLSFARHLIRSYNLDHSQKTAILECISRKSCTHRSTIKLIWGPPGTGKTKTVASLLYVLLRMQCRTLTCAPTNVAVVGVASRLMALFRNRLKFDTFRSGDIVLFSNREQMKIDSHEDLHDVFLDFRVSILIRCSCPETGWIASAKSFINLLEDPLNAYTRWWYLNKGEENIMTFEDFYMSEYSSIMSSLLFCTRSLYTHYPTNLIPPLTAVKMIRLVEILKSSQRTDDDDYDENMNSSQIECVQILKTLLEELNLPKTASFSELKRICLQNALLVFCTASSSSKLQSQGMNPFELLVVDEAAQLKESESTIPLQLPGLRHAILIGDEKQLPAMVQSRISEKAMFGRSLFERMVNLGIQKHLLNIQYRMHPSISMFPNQQFYQGKILNGPNVIKAEYRKQQFLEGPMFGSYSFIDLPYGMENNNGHEMYSKTNMVEVAVVAEIIERVYKESVAAKRKVSIGCISPYKAQVNALQKRLGRKYDNRPNFSVSVRSVDGFQGGEEDIIIISTVRCNFNGSIGFLSNLQRANVALTRARYGTWILGNAAALINSGSVWKNLVIDALSRGCYFDASDDDNLSRAIYCSLSELNQLHLLFNSLIFKDAKWKVHFCDEFFQSMRRSGDFRVSKDVISLIERLSTGWREHQVGARSSLELLELYKINNGPLSLVWSVDIVLDGSRFTQVIKIWNILPPSKIPQMVKELETVFGNYKVSMMNRCKTKIFDGELIVPSTWRENKRANLQLKNKSKSSKNRQ